MFEIKLYNILPYVPYGQCRMVSNVAVMSIFTVHVTVFKKKVIKINVLSTRIEDHCVSTCVQLRDTKMSSFVTVKQPY